MKLIFNLLGCLLLVACGFKLQSPVDLKDRYFIVEDAAEQKALVSALKNRLVLAGAVLVTAAEQEPKVVHLALNNWQEEKQLLASGQYGQGQVYLLTNCIDLRLNAQTTKLCAQRRITEDYKQKLSNINGMHAVRAELDAELLTLILLKLGN